MLGEQPHQARHGYLVGLVPGGKQQIKILDGYIIPLIIKDELTRLDIRPHTDQEYDTLPHVFLTSKLEWDPTVFDHAFDIESD